MQIHIQATIAARQIFLALQGELHTATHLPIVIVPDGKKHAVMLGEIGEIDQLNDFIGKPANPDRLYRVLYRWLERGAR